MAKKERKKERKKENKVTSSVSKRKEAFYVFLFFKKNVQ
ncbi:hypothetical protein HDEF_1534 [Candidatus Hamiltonella defensa 5AT (Acyrthosiphon pisum)]|uniref:Uncharacterized protein n=1 Tax=Hamiltonella defensa subsp. Acyrthosiphon pisum (strain 5AT) TaxID=572265 RepID=C4K6G0_HAMD5|nr:hypothetical protein HDEF_1534 [Candidatus Hamiltonella defensa 5AT (Acyrthosiphon pisum)]